MKTTRINKHGREVISAEHAHHLATAPFLPTRRLDPSYIWAGAGIAQPLIGNRVRRGRLTEEDADPYEADDNVLAIL